MTPALLHRFLAAEADRAFAWGESDCTLLVADWIRAARGFDPAEGWRGTYDDAPGARGALARRFGRAPDQATALARLGDACAPPCPVLMARRGDVALLATDGPGGAALGIVTGASAAVRRWPAGLAYLSLAAALRAWRLADLRAP